MDAKQHMYYALGALAYAVAKADGKVQKEEQNRIQKIISEGIQSEIDFTYTDIIFQILQKDKMGFKDVYEWAIHAFETGKYHLTEEVQQDFKWVIEEVAKAFPPKDPEEIKLLNQFESDLKKLASKTAHD